MKNPLSTTDEFILIRHLQPVTSWRPGMPGPLALSTFLNIGTFQDLSESVVGLLVGEVLNLDQFCKLGLIFDLGKLERHIQ